MSWVYELIRWLADELIWWADSLTLADELIWWADSLTSADELIWWADSLTTLWNKKVISPVALTCIMLLCMRKVDTESGHKLQPKLVYVSRLRDIWTSTVDCKWKQLCSSTSPVDRVATGASAAPLNVPKFHEKSDWFRLSHLAHQKQDVPEEAPSKL